MNTNEKEQIERIAQNTRACLRAIETCLKIKIIDDRSFIANILEHKREIGDEIDKLEGLINGKR